MWNWTPLTINVRAPGASGANSIELVGANTLSSVDPCPARTCAYSAIDGLAGILAYGGMAVAPNLGSAGSIVVTGGGHSDYFGNEVYAFDLATNVWSRLSDPSTAFTPSLKPNGSFDETVGEYGDGSPMASHTYDVLRVIPGGSGGKGQLLMAASPALSFVAAGGHSAPWSHACDLGLTAPAAATSAWSRFSVNGAFMSTTDYNVPNATCYDAGRSRVWELYRGGFHSLFAYLDLSTGSHTMVPFPRSDFGTNPCAAQFPVSGLMLFVTGVGTYLDYDMAIGAVDLANPAAGLTFVPLTGTLPPHISGALPPWGFDWDWDLDAGFVFAGDVDPMHVYRIDPPANDLLTTPWMVTRIALPQSMPLNGADGYGVYGHWRYVPTIRKFAYVSTINNQVALYTPHV